MSGMPNRPTSDDSPHGADGDPIEPQPANEPEDVEDDEEGE